MGWLCVRGCLAVCFSFKGQLGSDSQETQDLRVPDAWHFLFYCWMSESNCFWSDLLSRAFLYLFNKYLLLSF